MATILIVDDIALNRDLLTTLLRCKGHALLEAEDGAQALKVARAGKPDVVIADILMPGMDGFEFVRQLGEEPETSAAEVIFCTANYDPDQERALARDYGVRYLLTKPAEPQEILETVEAALAAPRTGPASAPAADAEVFDQGYVRALTDQLAVKAEALQTTNGLLMALVELSDRLGTERDPLTLLQQYCSTGRRIIGATSAGLGIIGPDGRTLVHFTSSGTDPPAAGGSVLELPINRGVLAQVAAERSAQRLAGLQANSGRLDLPDGHRPAASFLAVPVASPSRVYGWMFFTDRVGAAHFSEEDQRLTEALGAQVGVAYENADRYRELERHDAELERLNEELDAFSYSVSHDLRAPLRAVSGFASALVEDCGGQIDSTGHEYLTYIQENARTMGTLIDNLLAFSRSGRAQMEKVPINMTALVRSAFEEVKRETPGQPVRLQLRTLPRAQGDRLLIHQVLHNLLSNAVKFAGKRDDAVVEVSGHEVEDGVEYCVQDNGAGFDMTYVDKLFGVFQRLHATDEFEGTGIGLSIVRRIIHRHDGRVRAVGQVGEGAAFYFTLPAAPGAAHVKNP
jgi:signal transduction histidine kinase/CheY-like chemotaxis protein